MPTSWETADILTTPMEVCWQFDYEIEIEKLRGLYAKAKQNQWDAERDIDWSLPIDPSKPLIDESQFIFHELPIVKRLSESQREEFRAHIAAHLLSQFLHGEQGALMTSAALTHAVPDYEGKLYAATQTMDEARHVEVYQRYIDKLAIIYPLSPWLKELIDVTLQADHWIKIAIGMNMVVEGLALGAFHNMRRKTTCDLLRQVTVSVLRDGAAHGSWRALGLDTIEVETEIADHVFRIHTGYRPDASAVGRQTAPIPGANAPSTSMNRGRLSPIELVSAGLGLSAGGGCPCCAGV